MPETPQDAGADTAILHVDDSTADQHRRRRALEQAGFRVLEADTGAAARDLFAAGGTDLILLDVRLPDITGFELAREFKAQAAAAERDTGIILISSYFTESSYRVQGLESGADAYLIEPISDAELVATVRAVARQLAQHRRARVRELELRHADLTKNEFLAQVVHDIREPIQAAVAGLAVLKSRDDPAVGQRALSIVERQLHQISRITGDLLDAARIMRGEVTLRRERQDLCAIVRRSLDTVRASCTSRQLELGMDLCADPVTVEADGPRLEQVFVNLLSNAMRYTPAGGRIVVTVASTPGTATVSVTDTGEGIAPEQLTRIFQVFVRASEQPGGLGIGLAVARTLVEAHGGTIAARSQGLGRGSEFIVTLPAA